MLLCASYYTIAEMPIMICPPMEVHVNVAYWIFATPSAASPSPFAQKFSKAQEWIWCKRALPGLGKRQRSQAIAGLREESEPSEKNEARARKHPTQQSVVSQSNGYPLGLKMMSHCLSLK